MSRARAAGFAAIAVAVAGCPARPVPPAVSQPVPGVRMLAQDAAAAPAPSAPLESAVLKGIAAAASRGGCAPPVYDAGLASAATKALARGASASTEDFRRFRFFLWEAGLSDDRVTPYVGKFSDPVAATASVERNFAPAFAVKPCLDRMGIAVAGAAQPKDVAVLLSERAVELRPFPVSVETGATLPLEARSRGPRQLSRVLLGAPSGRVTSIPFAAPGPGGWASATLAFPAESGEWSVEILSQSADEVEILASFPVYVSVQPPAEPPSTTSSAGPAEAPAEAERVLLERLNAERARYGLRSLVPLAKLGDFAREHSRERAKSGSLAARGTFAKRIEALGLGITQATEAIVRERNATAAHAVLMASPAMRRNLLNPSATHVGVGVAVARGPSGDLLVVTEVFGAIADAADLRAEVLRLVNKARAAKGLEALEYDASLSAVAATHSAEMRKRGKVAYDFPGYGDVAVLAQKAARGAKALGAAVLATAQIDAVGDVAEIQQARFDTVGIGVELQPGGTAWITLLLVDKNP